MSKYGLAGISLRKPGMARDIVPPVVGAAAAVGTVTAIRASVDPTDPKVATVFQWAPAIGGGVSLLAAGVIYAMGGAGPAVATALSGILSSLGIFAADMIVGKKLGSAAVLQAAYPPSTTTPAGNTAVNGLANLAAVVPEYSRQMAGILFQKMDGLGDLGIPGGRNLQQAGTHVQLRGVSQAAFGKRAFAS